MESLLSKLKGPSKNLPIEPREIFMSLPKKYKKYEYPRDVQTETWKKWYQERNNKNNIIKMNTGSGKTVVGLIILQSCLNEEKGPAIYVVPDNYLVNQVLKTAEELGIPATNDKHNFLYRENKSILVCNIYELVNGRSSFGTNTICNHKIGSIVVDDVHACMNTIMMQYSIKIERSHSLYKEMLDLFLTEWKTYDSQSYIDIIESDNPYKRQLIPFWMWQNKQEEVYKVLSKYNTRDDTNENIYFKLPLIQKYLKVCDCFVTNNCIEIIPDGIAISEIHSFENATRRIFMSATLSDDSVFTKTMGLNKSDIKMIITPEKADDIGDRLILFPKHLNNNIDDKCIMKEVYNISMKYNVVVIVPSFKRAKEWDETETRIIKKENINTIIETLKSEYKGLVILVNRYDGIDLPDDACRLLVIDGLPPLNNEKDKYLYSIDPSNNILIREQMQRIEQGMGRGVRSNSDYCCIVLMGEQLSNVLITGNGQKFFSNATKAQYELSKELWSILKEEKKNVTVDDIFELTKYSLDRDVQWIEKSKERLTQIEYISELNLDKITTHLRNAFDYLTKYKLEKSITEIDEAIKEADQDATKGYLLQVKAKYTNLIDKMHAQEILLSGRAFSNAILEPIKGTNYKKNIDNYNQAKNIVNYISEEGIEQQNFILFVNETLSGASFSSNFNDFEKSIMKLGSIIGFESSRPDKESKGIGPDNLWKIETDRYIVFECKNEANTDDISKDYCNQLGGSLRWFECNYKSAIGIPVMIIKTRIINSKATKVNNMRVMDEENLERLKSQVNDFSVAISRNENWGTVSKIHNLICDHKLLGKDIIENYTVECK